MGLNFLAVIAELQTLTFNNLRVIYILFVTGREAQRGLTSFLMRYDVQSQIGQGVYMKIRSFLEDLPSI